jgi:hypothetical protein
MGYSDFFAEKLADACIKALPNNKKGFDPEYIRVAKILGSNVYESFVL